MQPRRRMDVLGAASQNKGPAWNWLHLFGGDRGLAGARALFGASGQVGERAYHKDDPNLAGLGFLILLLILILISFCDSTGKIRGKIKIRIRNPE